MTRSNERTFGHLIRERRRQLNLTQEEVARQIRSSTPYIGHLESHKRHPSDKVISRLADVLGLDRRELFFLANPRTQASFIQRQTLMSSLRGSNLRTMSRSVASTT